MTANVADMMIYFCKNKALSKARLAKMVYLADWKSCLDKGHQLTELKWVYDHYGPYLRNFYEIAQSDPRFETYSYGNADMIAVKNDIEVPEFQADDMGILSHVKETAKSEPFRSFLKRIYATYPIRTQEQYSTLNLPQLARLYKEEEASA